jgi:hypothetical protein
MDIMYKYEKKKILGRHLTEDIKWDVHVKHLSSNWIEAIM